MTSRDAKTFFEGPIQPAAPSPMPYLRRLRHRAEHHIVTSLSTRPLLYYGLRTVTNTMDPLCVNRDSELVIEGYPRSANSSAVHGFLARQSRPVRVAHHKHHAAQLIRAANWNIPAVLLIRRPADAIVSLAALAEEGRRHHGGLGGRGSAITFSDSARAWLIFYTAVLPHLGHLLVAPFSLVIADLDAFILQINERWGTTFLSGLPASAVAPKLGWHATPNDLRNAIKRDIKAQFDAAAREPQLSNLIDRCDRLHDQIVLRA